MKEDEFLDNGLKRLAYTFSQEFALAAAYTLYYGKSLSHFAEFFLAATLNFLTIPLVLFTDVFSGLTSFEWFGIVILWLISISAALNTT